MSGTSLDGIDVVLADLCHSNTKLLATHCHTIPALLKSKISAIIQPDWVGSIEIIGKLHHQLGKLFADSVKSLLKQTQMHANEITAIGSHGQTVWHQPEGKYPFSLQLGDANLIAELTGITTVADFRSRDIAAGGQGAPLVPAFHQQALTAFNKNRIILNIGGIANITYLPESSLFEPVLGFDTGPGNGLLDAWIKKNKNKNYDKNGNWARAGKVQHKLLSSFLSDPFFKLHPPKSTGKEVFNLAWIESHLNKHSHTYPAEDVQATLLELTAKSIADALANPCDELYVCGGGAHNDQLMSRLQCLSPHIPIQTTQALGIHPDWVEALAFAWLAKQAIENQPGNLPSATGAKGARVLGAIYPGIST